MSAQVLTAEQSRAVDLVVRQRPRLVVITGGPGTGKSTTLRTVLDELDANHARATLLAPSGKAAVRLREATGRQAHTIHSAFGLLGGFPKVTVYPGDVVIVDECSLVDSRVMAAVFEHAAAAATLVLVGDADQLPPVQEGCPFQDLVRSELVPTVRLTVVHRQAAESGIVRAAHRIHAGRVPEWCDDVRFVRCEDAEEVGPAVVEVVRGLDRFPTDVQVLSPQKTGPAGTWSLNLHLEAARGNHEPTVRERYRVGTRVIQIVNDYERQVMNGEQGVVIEALPGQRPHEDKLVVELDGAQGHVPYVGSQLGMLQPAWAVTVHKSQGSEWDSVVVVAHPSVGFLLTRSLLYVAVTRAQRRVVVVGQEETVAKAVAKDRDQRRRTLLGLWLNRAKEAA